MFWWQVSESTELIHRRPKRRSFCHNCSPFWWWWWRYYIWITHKSALGTQGVWWEVWVEWRKFKAAVSLEKNKATYASDSWNRLHDRQQNHISAGFGFFLEWICGFMPPSNILVYQNVFYGLLISCLLNFPYYHCCSHSTTADQDKYLKRGEKFKIQNMPYIKKKKMK